MKISVSQLLEIMPNADEDDVEQFVLFFNKHSDDFGITNGLRAAHFISQVAVESGELKYTAENLNYSAKGLLNTFPKYFNAERAAEYARNPQRIASRVYANRMGNKNEASGDGWKFRGRGLIQLTGRNNYAAYCNSGLCNGNLMAHPEWLEKYPGALKSAMYFWMANGLNELADKDDVVAVTKRVNGGRNGLAARQKYYERAKGLLCD